MKRSFAGSGVLAFAVVLTLVAIATYTLAQSTGDHTTQKDCLACHLNDPKTVASVGDMLFKTDFTVMCSNCHEGIETLSHPVGMPVSAPVPSQFPTDWRGYMTCVTCHHFHNSDNAKHLRVATVGRDFCLLCHTTDFFNQMKDAGETLKLAHLENLGSLKPPPGAIDSVSMACLECHDGSVAISTFSNVPLAGSFVTHTGGPSHPIGADYSAKARADKSYNPPETLPKEVALSEGKVGCVSCHQPYTDTHGKSSVGQTGSQLCFACHNI